jgi:hypothetical protein
VREKRRTRRKARLPLPRHTSLTGRFTQLIIASGSPATAGLPAERYTVRVSAARTTLGGD